MVLEKDPLLVGFDISKFVFTDISYGIPGISCVTPAQYSVS